MRVVRVRVRVSEREGDLPMMKNKRVEEEECLR